MGLTTWTVASVSIWLVPAYLALMIGIFVLPGARGAKSAARQPTTGPTVADVPPSGEGSESDRADRMGPHHPAAEPSAETPAGEATEASATRVDPAGPLLNKPRRGRARSRKAARTAAEPAEDSSPVTWIRVGPGQFVRADGRTPEPHPATAEEVTAEAHPETDEPRPVAPELEVVPDADPMIDGLPAVPSVSPPTGPLDAPADAVLPDSPESPPVTERAEPSTGENPREPSAEEYGIAPSAFGAETGDSPSSPNRDPGVSDVSVLPMADPGPCAESDGTPSDGDVSPDRPGLPRQRSQGRTAFLLHRGIANASLGRLPSASSLRRGDGNRPGPRAASGRRSARDPRLRQAARRAFGRTDHVRRDRRPRAPPCHAA